MGTTIARLRAERGWTQVQLAERLDMHAQHIYRLEKDRYKPRPKTLERLAEVLGVGADVLTASRDHSVPTSVALQDEELSDLMAQVPVLDSDQKHALKTFLKALLTCQHVQRLAGGNLKPQWS